MRESETLKIGDPAPEFDLRMANPGAGGPRRLSLEVLLEHGPVIVEFLRGTW